MSLKQKFSSLRYRMALMLMAAVAVGALLFTVTGSLSAFVIRRFYLSDSAIQARNVNRLEEFQKFVQVYHVSTAEKSKIVTWCRANRYVTLTVYQQDEVIFESEGTFPSKTEDPFSFVISIGPGNTAAPVQPLPSSAVVQFSNGAYSVSILDMGEERSYLFGTCMALLVAVAGFLAVMLTYNRRVTQSVIALSHDVNEVSQGNLDLPIRVHGTGELAELAEDVNKMRTSIMERMQQENIAWQANRDLITSLSHDLRTPLTALIGYLNLIEEGEFSSLEDLTRYSKTALDKAMRIKTLSDELFRYFVVYGRPKHAVQTQVYDAQILLEQLLGERVFLMTEKGYQFRQVDRAQGCRIRVNVDSMTRVFDNLFSNMEKYADPNRNIVIYLGREEGQFSIVLSNACMVRNTESTRIGLETCRKLIQELDGTFSSGKEAQEFVTRITLPLAAEEPDPAPPQGAVSS